MGWDVMGLGVVEKVEEVKEEEGKKGKIIIFDK